MSWITRWGIKDMRKWGGWHSLEDRENYLLGTIEQLENEIKNVKIENEIINKKLDKIGERVRFEINEAFENRILVKQIDPGIFTAELKKERK